MECVYINMDAATERRQSIESNFAACSPPGWQLRRFPAVNGRLAEQEGAEGRLSPAEKGCFLSHRGILSQSQDDGAPLFIVEDDAQFGQQTCKLIDELIEARDPDSWDLIFTDACIPIPQDMISLVQARRLATRDSQLMMFDMRHLAFAGSTAYVVNGRAKSRMLQLLAQAAPLDVPYDLYLRQLIHAGSLRAYLAFPFVTTLSAQADQSSIHGQEEVTMDIVRNAFRRLMYLERNLLASATEIRTISERFGDDDAILAGALLGVMTSSELNPK